jgi:hypothetical protein
MKLLQIMASSASSNKSKSSYFIGFGSIKLRPEFKVKKKKSNQKPLVCVSIATA